VPRAIVTGAAGFLGSHLVDRLLDDGLEVGGLDNLSTGRIGNLRNARRNDRFRFVRADLRRSRALPAAREYYHLASPASPRAYQDDPIGTLRTSAEGTRAVLDAARRADARVLFTSTSEVYGDPEVHPQPESYWGHVNPIGLRSCYDEGKRYAEALCVAYRREYGLDVRIARVFNTYGPRMDLEDGRVISNFLVQGLRGRPFTIYGRGRQTRSFCYVSDLVRGLESLMGAAPSVPTPMNLGNPHEITILEASRQVSRALGIPWKVRYRPLPEDDPKQRCPNIARARRLLGWRPRIPLPEGLRETVPDFRTRVRG
jgi:UDP-glucuronate decarboxylase